jgi:hypothetical protein
MFEDKEMTCGGVVQPFIFIWDSGQGLFSPECIRAGITQYKYLMVLVLLVGVLCKGIPITLGNAMLVLYSTIGSLRYSYNLNL